jgi:hypothetical protein
LGFDSLIEEGFLTNAIVWHPKHEKRFQAMKNDYKIPIFMKNDEATGGGPHGGTLFPTEEAPAVVDWKVHTFGRHAAWLQPTIYAAASTRAKPSWHGDCCRFACDIRSQ